MWAPRFPLKTAWRRSFHDRARVEFRFASRYLCLQNKHCATVCNKRAASNRIYVCVFRRQPLDNHRQDYVLHTISRTSKTCLSAIRVIKTNKIALANALQAPTTRRTATKGSENQKQINFSFFKIDGSITKNCYLDVRKLCEMEAENDKLKVRMRERGRESNDERNFWEHYDFYEALSLCSNWRYRLCRLVITRLFTGHFIDAAFGSHDPFGSQLESWTSLLSAPSIPSNCRKLLVGIYFYLELEYIVYHHFVRTIDPCSRIVKKQITLRYTLLSLVKLSLDGECDFILTIKRIRLQWT